MMLAPTFPRLPCGATLALGLTEPQGTSEPRAAANPSAGGNAAGYFFAVLPRSLKSSMIDMGVGFGSDSA
jgi:hypothetical protein